jgi:4-diphosphocytidyl-2-C-methyl-D-erythritol kinase
MTQGTSFCEGTGDILTPIETSKTPIYLVIAKNARKSSTGDAYARLDEKKPLFVGSHEKVIEALKMGSANALVGNMGNSFESVVFELTPQVSQLREKMLTLGALDARMTGAGPTVFGVFENRKKAKLALDTLRESGVYSFLVNLM